MPGIVSLLKMFTDNELSTTPVPAPFRIWLRGERNSTEDYCRGGVAVNDASAGLDIQVWKGSLNSNGSATVAAEMTGYNEAVPINRGATFAGIDAKNLSVAFDNNMQPCATVMQGRDCLFYWYDATVSRYTTLVLTNCRDAVARTDDVRIHSLLIRDIILSYVREDNMLCFRMSRDRYQIEYPLATIHEYQRLYQAGMNEKLRFQWQLVWDPKRMGFCI